MGMPGDNDFRFVVERFGWTFAPGDKVMQVENDYDKEVYNGDIGFVAEVDPELGELTAHFDGRSVTYAFGELDVLVPAYAATIHKSQGSEYPAVIIPVMTQHYPMLQRNSSTPASRAASASWFSSARRRRLRSRSGTSRVADAGRNWTNGFGAEFSVNFVPPMRWAPHDGAGFPGDAPDLRRWLGDV